MRKLAGEAQEVVRKCSILVIFVFYEQVALTRELSGEEMAKLIVGMYVHTCCVLIKAAHTIYYVLAAVFASWFCVLISLLHE